MSIGNIYVPSEGNPKADIFVVGEAGGQDEEDEKRPFVGKAGQFLERYFNMSGISREDLFLSNLSKFRPKYNKFEYLLESPELKKGLEELKEEILTVNPKVILALGNWPLYFLTGLRSDKKNAEPGSGISQWRGSFVPSKLVEGCKVSITYHPAFVVRTTGFENHPIFLNDIRRTIGESSYGEIRYPKYETIIDPPADRLAQIVEDFQRAEFLTVDIETFGSELACVGFCSSVDRAVCLTFRNSSRNWQACKDILNGPAKKIFQYGVFDINYLRWYYGWDTNNFAWDTYVAGNNLMPGFPKTLAFLTSIYTKFPYYKEDRKTWRASYDLDKLFNYNMKDVIATHTIAMEQMKEIPEIYPSRILYPPRCNA